MTKLYVRRGYEIIGEAANYEEAKQICENYCKEASGGKVSFELKRELVHSTANIADFEYCLVYQYHTLYLEMFYISKHLDL